MTVVACWLKLLRSSLSSSFCRLSLLLLLSMVGEQGLWAQDPVHRRYTVADGLPSNTIYCALQDRDGFMWFGTDAGAVRFDGRTFRTYALKDGLSDIEVINLAQDSQGRVWFLTLNGKLCFYLDGTIYNERTVPDLGRFQCKSGWQSFAEDKHGRVWFGGVRNDVLRLDLRGDADSLWHWNKGEMSVLRDEQGEVLISRSQQILVRANDIWNEIPTGHKNYPNSVIHPALRQMDRPSIIDFTGVFELQNGLWVQSRAIRDYFDPTIHVLCWRDALGDLWIRRVDAGVDHVEGADHALPKRFFQQERISYVFVDAELNRWFCTPRQGLILVNAQQWSTKTYPIGSSEIAARSLTRDHLNKVWCGTSGGGVYCLEREGVGPDRGNILLGRIMGLVEGPDGGIYAGTDRWVLRIDPLGSADRIVNSWSASVGMPHSLWRFPAKDICFAPDGTLWTSYFDIWSAKLGRDMALKSASNATFNDRVPCIHVDPHGRTWFAAANSLYYVNADGVQHLDQLSDSMGLRISDITSWSPDTLLVATIGAGLRLIANERIVAEIDTRHGLLSNDVLRVRIDQGKVLVCTTHGLSVSDHVTPDAAQWINLTTSHGLPSQEVNDALFDGDGIYAATGRGLCRVPWPTSDLPMPPPRVYFATAKVGTRNVLGENALVLGREDPGFSVRFSAIAFAEPNAVQYQYRLRDKDPWVASTTGVIDLVSPVAGSYAIAARARNAEGPWSSVIRLPFVVEAAWWERWPAQLAATLVLIGLVLLLNTLRTKRKYQKVIAELRERQMIASERGRIAADIHDDLGADLSLLVQQANQLSFSAEAHVFSDMTAGLERTIGKLDEIIWSLDPKRDTLQATATFIEKQAAEYLALKGIDFRTEVGLPQEGLPLTAEARREVLLIVREALRNVVQHAQATEVWVRWSMESAVAVCQLDDNGTGFQGAASTRVQNGTRNIRDRADRLGGTVSWTAKTPHGTRLELRFPIA